jgi:sulfoxide reductase heme-binding subunit YedZ
MTSAGPHLFWITSRAAGTAALALSSVSVGVGLSMGGKLMKRRSGDNRVLHEALSLSVMVALAIHAFSLLGDKFMHPSVVDITVPFASSYKTLWMSVGVIAGWALVALGLSYYLRAKIGVARWRIIHRFTLVAWIAGLVHSLGMGTDAGQKWFLALVIVTAAPALIFFGARMAAVYTKRTAGSRAPDVHARRDPRLHPISQEVTR